MEEDKTSTQTKNLGPKTSRNVEYCEAQWFTPTITAIWEAEIWRLTVQGQPRKKSLRPHLNQ
jgi:hypothetical protein